MISLRCVSVSPFVLPFLNVALSPCAHFAHARCTLCSWFLCASWRCAARCVCWCESDASRVLALALHVHLCVCASHVSCGLPPFRAPIRHPTTTCQISRSYTHALRQAHSSTIAAPRQRLLLHPRTFVAHSRAPLALSASSSIALLRAWELASLGHAPSSSLLRLSALFRVPSPLHIVHLASPRRSAAL